MFTETSKTFFVVVMIGWGLAQISVAMFLSVFLSKSQTASIIGYTAAVWVTMVACVLNLTIYGIPNKMDNFLYIIPSFSFSRVIYLMAKRCGYGYCVRGFHDIDEELSLSLAMIFLMSIVYLLLALYLYQVVPQTYGVPKKWNYLWKTQTPSPDLEEEEEEDLKVEYDQTLEDSDAKAERTLVHNIEKDDFPKYPLIIKDLHKVYPSMGGIPPKVATKNFSLRIKNGEMFGLLGPNGAGKTTLISMLTGMYRPTSGNAWIAGNDIKTQLETV